MTCNQTHGHRTTLERMMREHDALPQIARMVGCYAVSKYDAISCRAAVQDASFGRPSLTRTDILQRALALLDKNEAEDTFRFYGPKHPECPSYFLAVRPPKGAWWHQPRRGRRA